MTVVRLDADQVAPGWKIESEVTTDQTPATTDYGTRYLFTLSTAADRKVTLPSVGSDEDGMFFWVTNDSDYTITVAPSDSDSIWVSGAGYGIDIVDKGTTVCVRYDHSNTRWDVIHKTGGKVMVEGAKLYCRCGFAGVNNDNNASLIDDTMRHSVYSSDITSAFVSSDNTKAQFGQGVAFFDGVSGYFQSKDTADWDFFGSTGDDWTISLWVYCDDAAGSVERIITQYEDANNYWSIWRAAGGAVSLSFVSGGSGEVVISGGSFTQSTWHHVMICHVGAESGLYVDGTQVAYDATFTPDTFSGGLYMGQLGGGSQYFDGRMDDVVICNQNIFNAAPNSTPDDTITVPGQAMNIVM